MIRKRYVDGPFGQVHLRESGAGSGTVPLVCLHATAYSSRSFAALMREFGDARHVIAVDLPGYGESSAPPAPLDIAGYARAVAEAVAEAVGNRPIDLLGYHTGVYVAAELALIYPERVRQMTWLGVPYFHALDFAAWRAKLAAPHTLTGSLDQFAERWDWLVTQRPEGLPLARGFQNFVDELKAWPNGSWAHAALFAYDAPALLPLITAPVTVLNPVGHLAEPSRVAAGLLQNAALIELPHLTGAVLDTAAAAIAALIPSAAGSDHR